jgi:hypothetical protein
MTPARQIAERLNNKLLCPVCSNGFTMQPMTLYAEDIVPERDVLFCPHCELELYLTTVEKKQ